MSSSQLKLISLFSRLLLGFKQKSIGSQLEGKTCFSSLQKETVLRKLGSVQVFAPFEAQKHKSVPN